MSTEQNESKTGTPSPERLGSADDLRFRWLVKNLPAISYNGCGEDEGLRIEWSDNAGSHVLICKNGIHAEDQMRNAIDQAMQNKVLDT